jgi:hypothetical protein
VGTLVLGAGVLATGGLTGCGEGLTARVERAMDACVAVRNPAFLRGEGEAAVARPLPDSILALGDRTAYQAGLDQYQAIGGEAATQAILTCAMELGARYRHPDTKGWLGTFARHPNAPVARLAARLVAAQP